MPKMPEITSITVILDWVASDFVLSFINDNILRLRKTAGNWNVNDTLVSIVNTLSTIIKRIFEPKTPIIMPINPVIKNIAACSINNMRIIFFRVKPIN